MSSWGFHKPGQGYWVRVLTAAAIAIITFATAGWLMGQMNVLSTKLPVRSWNVEVGTLTGTAPKVGERVTLVRNSTSGSGQPETMGTAEVSEYSPTSSALKIKKFEPANPEAKAEDASVLKSAAEGGFSAPIKNGVRGIPLVQSTILQGIAAAVVLLSGALIAFLFCGNRPGTVEFLVATDMEMKKVAWSTRKDIWNSTLVVVGASFLLSTALFGIDLALQFFFKAINVLQ